MPILSWRVPSVSESSLPYRLTVPPTSIEIAAGETPFGGFHVSDGTHARARRLLGRLAIFSRGEGARLPLEINMDVADDGEDAARAPPEDMDESYELTIRSHAVHIAAPEVWGALRALALLANLIDEHHRLPHLCARDAPRYTWRGLMLDPARRFLSLGALKRTLLGMWACRLNVLHLHLSDDQGLRVPLLGHAPVCPHYSHAEVRELVDYASDLGIRIVPEIDLPGHATGLLVSFPHWAVNAPPAGYSKRFGVHMNLVDCASVRVREELDAMIGELAGLFPDACLHFGGDECMDYAPPVDFSSFLVDSARHRGKQAIFWDEALAAHLPRSACVQVWRHHELLDLARKHGHAGILSAPYYLDLMFPSEAHRGFDPAGDLAARQAAQARVINHPGLASVRRALEWDTHRTRGLVEALRDAPPSALPGGEHPGALLGGEACLWGELVGEAQLDTRLWSRLPAIANRFWLGDASRPVHRRSAEAHLERIAGIRVGPQAWLERLPLAAAERDHLLCLLDCLEPVKWYARLLGPLLEERLTGGLAGASEERSPRPCDADSPLDQAVDFVNPESLQAADFMQASDKRDIARRWRAQRETTRQVATRLSAIKAIIPLSIRLADLAEVIDGTLDFDAFMHRHPDAEAPVAELSLAVLPVVAAWWAQGGDGHAR